MTALQRWRKNRERKAPSSLASKHPEIVDKVFQKLMDEDILSRNWISIKAEVD